MQGKTVRAGLAAALVLLPDPLAAQRRRDDAVGTLVLQGPTEAQTTRVDFDLVAVEVHRDDSPGTPGRNLAYVQVKARAGRPDLALLAWVADAGSKRRVTLEPRPQQGGTPLRYELEGAQLARLEYLLSRDEPVQVITIRPEHMRINGRPIY